MKVYKKEFSRGLNSSAMSKSHSILFILILSISNIVNAQPPHCSTVLNTTTSTINAWDWRAQVWPTNIYSTVSGQINSVVSPFHAILGGNLDNGSNKNIFAFVQSADKDNKPEDGWELIAKNLGITGQTPISSGYAIFYNKYTAKIRAFFLISQLFSDTGINDENKGGTVSITFNDERPNLYQSNLLSSYTSPLLPLDQFKRDANIVTANAFRSTLPYWLYADFPVAYDPCTCGRKASIRITTNLLSTGNVDIKINSLPYQSPVQLNAVNQSTDFLQGFSAFANQAEGGVKAAVSAGEAISKLNDAIVKQNEPQRSNLASNLSTLNNSLASKGNWTDLIPLAGNAVNSVISLIDYFVGGGKSTPGPSPVMIMNDFKATGTIESVFPKNAATFYLPGSDQTGRDAALAPAYNNIVGVFNLLYTPKVTIKDKSVRTSITDDCGTYSWDKRSVFFFLDENLKIVINPALNIDLSKSNVNAAFIIENCDPTTSGNPQAEVSSNDKPIYRSSYYPIGSISEGVVRLGYDDYPPSCFNGQRTFIFREGCPNPKVFIKIIAKLRRPNTTAPSEDIYFIAKYPVKINRVSTTESISGGLENIAEDVTLADNIAINEGTTFRALNTLSIGSSSIIDATPLPIFGEIDATLAAGESITIRAGGTISNRYSLKVGGIYSNTAPTLQSLQATSAELNTFCGSSNYNGLNNERNVALRIAAPEDQEVVEVDKFFTAFPNPTTGKVSFRYYVEEPSQVRLNLISTTGSVVATPVDAYQEAGPYEFAYDASNLPAGIYIYTLETSKGKETKRLVVIK
jgi:hypothetical protein